MTMRRSLLALTLACAVTACADGGDSSDGDAGASRPPTSSGASETPTEAASADAAAATACIETRLALTPLAEGLAGGDLESALLSAEVSEWEPSGTTPTVELALARMELQLSFAKQAVELGVFGADGRSDLETAYDDLADACAGIGSGF
jgi:hypothetical protein